MKRETANPTDTMDFVIFWVDDSDPAWQAAFRQAQPAETDDASLIRVRNWDNLRYWFRGVERFAPWVRKIHFVTWGHLPAWLDTSHPKLHVVRHEEFIPAPYLPTFNSIVIGINLHRIEGLCPQFVVFNDDMFLTRDCRPEDFFRRGLPCDMARLSIVQPSSIGHIIYNCLEKLNARYDKRRAIAAHPGKWFSPRYGASNLLKTLTLMPWSTFPGLSDHHLPQPCLTAQYERCWREWGGELDRTCRHRFRNLTCLSDYLFRYDMLVSGEFVPRSMRDGRLMTLADDTLEAICDDIRRQRWRTVCLNDSERISDFPAASQRLREAFHTLLPDPCSYER